MNIEDTVAVFKRYCEINQNMRDARHMERDGDKNDTEAEKGPS